MNEETTVRKSVGRLWKEVLRQYFSGSPAWRLSRRYGVSPKAIVRMADEYMQGKIDIFDLVAKKSIDMQIKKTSQAKQIEQLSAEVERLRARAAELEKALKMSTIKVEGYEIMLRALEEERGVNVLKKAGAERSRSSRSDTKK